MHDGLLLSLLGAALSLGALHSLAPDHWLPFAAVGRARGWSSGRTAGVTLISGFAHVTVSALLAVAALGLGSGAVETLGAGLASLASLLLLAFAAAYALWGLRRATRRRLPGLGEAGAAAEARASRLTVGSLLTIFALDPCLPLIPLVAVAASLGGSETALVVVAYAAATMTTMVALAVPARAGSEALAGAWVDRWGHAAAGAAILLLAIAVGALGI